MRRLLMAAAVAAFAGPALAAPAAAPAAYRSNCQGCHQAEAQGLPGQFPRLNRRAGQIASTPDGRKFLMHAVLFGSSGKIVVDGRTIIGVMPSFARLSDSDLAATLNYVARVGGGKPPAAFTAAEVKAARADQLSSAAVSANRVRLLEANQIP